MIKVFVIEDQVSYRESISQLINESKNFVCSGAFNDCESALGRIGSEKPDVLLLDINLPGISGVDCAPIIKNLSPPTEIIMLTVYDDNESIFNSLRNGASGYLLKNSPPENIIRAIDEVCQGGSPMSMAIARIVTKSFRKAHTDINMTDQQRMILHLLSKGKSYQAIANEMFIAKTTVKYHIRNIYKILQVNNKISALNKANQQGLL